MTFCFGLSIDYKITGQKIRILILQGFLRVGEIVQLTIITNSSKWVTSVISILEILINGNLQVLPIKKGGFKAALTICLFGFELLHRE